jgi:hypothetical protein
LQSSNFTYYVQRVAFAIFDEAVDHLRKNTNSDVIKVYVGNQLVCSLYPAGFEAWRSMLYPSAVTNVAKAQNYGENKTASHYQNYCQGMQWVETMQHIQSFQDPGKFKAGIEMIIRGYLDRLGKKEEEASELKKARWYLNFWIRYVENGNKPIVAKDYLELN